LYIQYSTASNQREIFEPSVGSVGDSYDNALAETINGLFKAEVNHRRGPWRSFDAVEYATLEWVDWFNNRRLLEPIGNIPPAEAEAYFYATLETSDMAAQLRSISLRQTRRGSVFVHDRLLVVGERGPLSAPGTAHASGPPAGLCWVKVA
jgi:hypothetical protein